MGNEVRGAFYEYHLNLCVYPSGDRAAGSPFVDLSLSARVFLGWVLSDLSTVVHGLNLLGLDLRLFLWYHTLSFWRVYKIRTGWPFCRHIGPGIHISHWHCEKRYQIVFMFSMTRPLVQSFRTGEPDFSFTVICLFSCVPKYALTI